MLTLFNCQEYRPTIEMMEFLKLCLLLQKTKKNVGNWYFF